MYRQLKIISPAASLAFDILLAGSSKSLSRDQLFATPTTVARQAPMSMEFSRQEYWSG